MLIDFHTHIYPEKLASRTVETLGGKAHIPHFTDGTLGSLTALMDREGVDRFVLLHIATSPKNEGNVNAFARQTNSARHPSFGSVHPDSARWKEELLALKEAGVKGVKFHNEYQSFFADDEKAFPLYAECGRLGLAMLFHGGADLAFSPPEKCSPARMARAAKAFPSANFIFAHLGGMRSAKDSIEFLAPLANVFTDTAFSSQYVPLSAGREVIEAFGAERVLFGTDCPWDTPARTLAYLKAMRLPPLWEEKIFYGNALQILED